MATSLPIRVLVSILLLPVNVVLVIPGLLMWLLGQMRLPAWSSPRLWLGCAIAAIGLVMSGWTVSLFVKIGKGTPAPWDAPVRLVIAGPYRHVRNPMISGVLLMLLGEAIVFWSWAVLAWFALFVVGNFVYMPLVEEKRLAQRYGEQYWTYKANVPRWLPRVRPWMPGQ